GGALGLALTFVLVLGWQRATLRLRTRLLAAQTDASFRAFLASMPDVVIVQRADGGIYLNEAAQGLLGERAEQAGLWLLRRVQPGDRRRATELLRRSTPRASAGLVELRVGGGEDWRDFEVTHQTIELVGALAHVLIGRDVTERRRLHAKMLVADRMVSLGTLAAGIGHEINNPLACVRGNLEVISELIAGDDVATSRGSLEEAVRDALEGADRVRVIVRGLRSFNHTPQELRVEVSLDEVLEQAVRLTHNDLRHRAELVLATEDVPLVLADPGRLTQVIINLLINASHAILPGAADHNQITLRTRTDHANGHAVLEVEDHGVGMAPDVVAHAFDPFFTTKRIGEGTGLGLSICHGIITGLGGQITIDSQPGRGTTVRISLPPSPTTRSAPAPAPARSSAVATAGRPRVLVVDDEPAVGNMLGRILRADCDVIVLTGGEDALRRVASGERYDVIVTDVMMPVMTGLELRERLLVVAPEQGRRVVFVTGGAFTAATAAHLEQLDVPRMTKPFEATELRRIVRDVVAARG
ncbi:MAG: ATP-binding protein, partial [Kofleriaceae bacterium]